MNESLLRARVRLFDRRQLVVLAAVCLLCLGGWLTYTAYGTSEEVVKQQTTERLTVTGTLSHGATVVEPTTVYGNDNETTVADEPLYYQSVSPTTHGDVAVDYDAESSENVTVTIDLEADVRAVDDDDTVYWNISEPLADVEQSDVEPGETVSAPFEINVTDLEGRIDEIEHELDASPGETHPSLDVTVSLEGTVEGEPVSETWNHQIDVEIDESTYSFDSDDSFTEPVTDTTTVTSTESPGPIYTVGGPFLSTLGVVVGGVVLWIIRYPPSNAHRRWIDYRDSRTEFDDVIVRANLLPVGDLSFAEIMTLEELAILAIDIDSVVLEARDGDRYVVSDRDRTYVYHPPPEPWNQSEPDAVPADER
ncbi:DUF5305 domain-containing protein [Natrarchaeobaculum aegyptiacum]|uniref:DUF5305 domain-containing protein n=1 Tax=Natrarchaeobaculum aegyptiacum TaxID=745377 RepID=A0A2Z2HW54_9EURY|nr:DUF5305 domain-containing protein [Natrarchaeobaculum aegyptiacum]ARS91471.1 hypothetical protein B1756_18250 [Natrarchaeobaculum aegyptiacum]